MDLQVRTIRNKLRFLPKDVLEIVMMHFYGLIISSSKYDLHREICDIRFVKFSLSVHSKCSYCYEFGTQCIDFHCETRMGTHTTMLYFEYHEQVYGELRPSTINRRGIRLSIQPRNVSDDEYDSDDDA
jgi:hypothetical protein